MANRDRHEVAEVLREAAVRLGADLTRTARDTQAAAQDLASAVRHSAIELSEDAGNRARTATRAATRAVSKQVRAHPAAWAAGAAGVGFLIGCLINRRHESPPFDA